MRYMLLIYGDEQAYASLPEEAAQAEMKRWYDYTDWLKEKGWYKAGDALLPTTQATTVRAPEGNRTVTDGPFAETKEQLGGYYEVDVADLDEAIEAAAECPGSAYGSIEVRPIMEFDQPQG